MNAAAHDQLSKVYCKLDLVGKNRGASYRQVCLVLTVWAPLLRRSAADCVRDFLVAAEIVQFLQAAETAVSHGP
jgi:hypothetical protein